MKQIREEKKWSIKTVNRQMAREEKSDKAETEKKDVSELLDLNRQIVTCETVVDSHSSPSRRYSCMSQCVRSP